MNNPLATARWVRNAADERAESRGYVFDVTSGAFAVWWIENYCRLYEGEWAGHPLVLRGATSQWPITPVVDRWEEGGKEQSIQRAERYLDARESGDPCDWQYDFVMQLFGWQVKSNHWQRMVRRFRRAAVWISKKNKKALATDTPIPTPNGWTTMGDLREGDVVFGEDGEQCRIAVAHPVIVDADCYRVSFSNGEQVTCNGEHLWKTTAWTGVAHSSWQRVQVRTTEKIYESLRRPDGAANHSLSVPLPVSCKEAPLTIDPYVLGLWLGDGDSDCGRMTCCRDDAEVYSREIKEAGYSLMEQRSAGRGRAGRFKILCQCETMAPVLRGLNLLKNKHIPDVYLRASVNQRLSLLQGLLDTDGCIDKPGRCITFCNTNKILVNQTAELLASLGVKYTVREQRAKISGVDKGPCWWIQFMAFRDSLTVFRLPRKLNRMRASPATRPRSQTIQITDVERVQPRAVRCITVDNSSGMFLCGRTMIPTHNSPTLAAIGLYLLCGDGEQGAKVFYGAKDGKQAKDIAGQHTIEMVLSSEILSDECTINRNLMRVTHESSRSYLEPMSSANKRTQESKEGRNGSMLVDETHIVDRAFMQRTSRMGLSRSEPLVCQFSTAGDDPEGYGKEEFDRGTDVARGIIEDDRYLFVCHSAPQDASDEAIDEHIEEYAKLANPAWGHTIDPDEFMNDYRASRKNPREWQVFKKYRLNVWQRTSAPWLSRSAWDTCGEQFDEESLAGKECVVSMDLSRTRDMSCLMLTFRDPDDDDTYRQLPYFWLPEDYALDRGRLAPFQNWAAEGVLNLCEGATINQVDIYKELERLDELFTISRLFYDPKFATELANQIQDELGIEIIEFQQTVTQICPAAGDYERAILNRMLRHNEHPVYTWQVGHCHYRKVRGNDKMIIPCKESSDSERKIDGVVAGLMGLWGAMNTESNVSAYETGGVDYMNG